MIFAAVLRTIWITRNDFVFNRSQWCGMQGMWNRLTYSCAQWKVLLKEEGRGELTTMLSKVEEVARCHAPDEDPSGSDSSGRVGPCRN
jgi:hypothetical protein